MSTQADSRWQQVRNFVRTFPIDLVLVLGIASAVVVGVGVLSGNQLWRFLIGGLLLFFLPGYTLLALIFPSRSQRTGGTKGDESKAIRVTDGISLRERIPLSFGASVTLLPLFALTLGILGQPLTRTTVVSMLSLFLIGCVLLAFVRRLRLPREDRFRLPINRWSASLRGFLFPGSLSDSLVNIVLAISLIAGLSAVGYAFAVPQPDAEFSSFALLTRTSDGQFVSSGYPTNFTQDQPQELVVSVANNQRSEADYTVVAELQQVRTNQQNRLQVLSEQEQRRFSVTLEPNETWRRPHDIRPQQSGKNLRLVYYLYEGDAPEDPNPRTANQHLQLWINVSTPAPTNNSTGTTPRQQIIP